MRGRIGVLLIGLVIVSLGAPAAGADVGAAVVLRPATGPPGSSLTVKASGFTPRERIHVSFDGTVEVSALANASGGLKRTFAVPASALPGTHDVNTTGLTSGLTADTSFLVQTDWPQFGGTPDHRWADASENVLSPSTVGGLQADWSQPQAGGTCVVLAGGVLYSSGAAGRQGALVAVDASTGAVKWANPAADPVFTDTDVDDDCAAVDRGTVFVSTSTAGGAPYALQALDAATGAQVWSVTLPGPAPSPTVAGGVVYVATAGGGDSALHAFKETNGKQLWEKTVFDESAFTTAAVADGRLYVGAFDGFIDAFDAATGLPVWSVPTHQYGVYAPAVANGAVYAGTGVTLYALDAAGGDVNWTFSPPGGVAFPAPAVANGMVYLAADTTYALNAATGAEVWSHTTHSLGSATVANGVVYVPYDKYRPSRRMMALKGTNGKLLWSADVNYGPSGGIWTSIIANGALYTMGSELAAYDLGGVGGTRR